MTFTYRPSERENGSQRNFINSDELHCVNRFNESDSDLYCNATFDGISCWPKTKAGTLAALPCFTEFKNVKYNATSRSATRLCLLTGNWTEYVNYSSCKDAINTDKIFVEKLENDTRIPEMSMNIYFVGYLISITFLLIALFIFIFFRELRCLRNLFHVNLMASLTLMGISWIFMHIYFGNRQNPELCFMMIFVYYFEETIYFWMFAEGLYLYILVVKTFNVENLRFSLYMFIGWGLPALIILPWAVAKLHILGKDYESSGLMKHFSPKQCRLMTPSNFDYFIICPIFIALLLNVFFLIQIMRVLVKKLRTMTQTPTHSRISLYFLLPRCSSKKLEQNHSIIWRSTKALLVLLPLLGIEYVLFIVNPVKGASGAVISNMRAGLISTQGLVVSVLYCFLNSEVRHTIKQRFNRWRERKNVGVQSTHSIRFLTRYSISRSQSISGRFVSRKTPQKEKEIYGLYNVSVETATPPASRYNAVTI